MAGSGKVRSGNRQCASGIKRKTNHQAGMQANQRELRSGFMREAQTTIASLRSVTKNYGGIAAVKEVNLDVRAGELLAVLGPSGAGKTASIRLLLGRSQPGSGEVRVFGRDPRRHENRTSVGAMLQVAKVPETLRVREHISLFRSYYPDPLPFAEIVTSAGLQGMEHRLFGSLSGGEKQRVLFALAICGTPLLIFLDEPTVGLDVGTRHLIWQQIRKLTGRGRTVLLTTHYLEELDALHERIVVLNQGTMVAEGSAAEIKSKTSLRKIRCATRLTPDEI